MGYLNDSEKKIIIPDPERAPYIKKAFEAYATGKYTLRQIRDMITGLGLHSMKSEELSVSVMHEILRNPIFCRFTLLVVKFTSQDIGH
jgi:hypothetical protein